MPRALLSSFCFQVLTTGLSMRESTSFKLGIFDLYGQAVSALSRTDIQAFNVKLGLEYPQHCKAENCIDRRDMYIIRIYAYK